jgi:hypothetical protein
LEIPFITTQVNESRVFQEGMVITIEPFLRVLLQLAFVYPTSPKQQQRLIEI